MMSIDYWVALRDLLNSAFGDENLTDFCFYRFRPVHDTTEGATKLNKIRKLIEYCQRRNALPDLLDAIEAEIPGRVKEVVELRRAAGLLPSPLPPDSPTGGRDRPAIPPFTINRQGVLDRFDQLLAVDNSHRLLRLTGEAKMGKTYLMTEIFPARAQQQQIPCAILKLQEQSRPENLLHNLMGMLGQISAFENFNRAYQTWLERPLRAGDATTDVLTQSGARSEGVEQDHHRHLLAQFVADLRALPETRLLLFLFDALDKADSYLQQWLIETLLVYLLPLPQVRVVVAGITIPMADPSYTRLCDNYTLVPVTDEGEYINYCRTIQANLDAQSIRNFAHVFDYKPGLFVDFVRPKFAGQRGLHD